MEANAKLLAAGSKTASPQVSPELAPAAAPAPVAAVSPRLESSSQDWRADEMESFLAASMGPLSLPPQHVEADADGKPKAPTIYSYDWNPSSSAPT